MDFLQDKKAEKNNVFLNMYKSEMIVLKMRRFGRTCFLFILSIAVCIHAVQAIDGMSREEFEADQEVSALINRLESANGHIPDDFTKADMDKFLAEADPDVVLEILTNICENAEPVSMDSEMVASRTSHNRSETYTEYNPETGVEITHSFSELNTEISLGLLHNASQILSDNGILPIASSVVPYAYPEY